MKKTVLLTSAALVAMTGVATAGTLATDSTGTTVKPATVAKEAAAGATATAPYKADVSTALTGTFVAGTPASPGDPNAIPPVPPTAAVPASTTGLTITPTNIPLGTLNNGIMNFQASTKWTVTGTDLSVCDEDGVQQLVYSSGSGTNSIIFSANGLTSSAITNGKHYILAWGATCSQTPVDPASKLELDFPQGTTSVALSVTTGNPNTQAVLDTAPATGTATILTVANQLSATVTKQVKNQIDFNDSFLSLIDNTTQPPSKVSSDTIDVSVTAAQTGVPATFSADDKVITTITVSDPAGLKATGTATGTDTTSTTVDGTTTPSGVFGDATCTDLDATTGKIVCTSTATSPLIDPATLPMTAPVVETFEYTVNTDGAIAITEKTFSVTTEYEFADTTMQNRTVANGNALLTNAPAGTWTFNGTTIHVPLVKGAGGHNTFIKLQSKVNAAVRGLVLCSDGVSRPVDLGTITAGTPMTITSDTVITALGSTGTVDPNGYAMTLSVTADQSNIFGYANTMDGNGNSRFIPLTAVSGIIQ